MGRLTAIDDDRDVWGDGDGGGYGHDFGDRDGNGQGDGRPAFGDSYGDGTSLFSDADAFDRTDLIAGHPLPNGDGYGVSPRAGRGAF